MKNISEHKDSIKIPADVPDGFFDIVSGLLDFVESVDKSIDEKDK